MITELVENITATEIVDTDYGTVLEVSAPGIVTTLEGGTQGPAGVPGATVTVFQQSEQPTALRTGDVWIKP